MKPEVYSAKDTASRFRNGVQMLGLLSKSRENQAMPVIDRTGQPLPDNHPLKGGAIFVGVKPPKNWSRPKPEQVEKAEPAETPDQQPDRSQPG